MLPSYGSGCPLQVVTSLHVLEPYAQISEQMKYSIHFTGVCMAGSGATTGGLAARSPRLWQDGACKCHRKRMRRSLSPHLRPGDCCRRIW